MADSIDPEPQQPQGTCLGLNLLTADLTLNDTSPPVQDATKNPKPLPSGPSQRVYLDDDLMRDISSHMDRSDCARLMQTSKGMMQVLVPKVYEAVNAKVVDDIDDNSVYAASYLASVRHIIVNEAHCDFERPLIEKSGNAYNSDEEYDERIYFRVAQLRQLKAKCIGLITVEPKDRTSWQIGFDSERPNVFVILDSIIDPWLIVDEPDIRLDDRVARVKQKIAAGGLLLEAHTVEISDHSTAYTDDDYSDDGNNDFFGDYDWGEDQDEDYYYWGHCD